MMMIKKMILILIALSSFFMAELSAQGWERHYRAEDSSRMAIALDQTMDNGFILLTGNRNPNRIPELIKTDVNGHVLWTKELNISAVSVYLEDFPKDVKQTKDGGYIVNGNAFINNWGLYLAKMDANGETLWFHVYTSLSNSVTSKIEETTDSGFVWIGSTNTFPNNYDSYVNLVKTDVDGNILWNKSYIGNGRSYGTSVKQTTDGGYILIGNTRSYFAAIKKTFLIKTDVNGDTLWTKKYGTLTDSYGGMLIEQTTDGGYISVSEVTLGTGGKEFNLMKLDALGATEWNQSLGSISLKDIDFLAESPEGGYVLAGDLLNGDNFILKTNAIGAVEWTRTMNYGTPSNFVDGVSVDGGYAILGFSGTWDAWSFFPNSDDRVVLLKTDSLGYTYTNTVKGNIFNDSNANCLKEIGESIFPRVLVEVSGNETWYGMTDTAGNYCIAVDTGSHVITVNEPTYWQSCTNAIPVVFSSAFTSDTINFPLQAQVSCPMMEVDLSAPFIRRNGNISNYTVNYCNRGTVDAINASVEVVIDADLDIISTSLPIASQVGNVLTFNLGDVNYGDCGNFYIQVRASSSSIIGQTHCSQAHIYPDTLCLPNPWTGPIIDANATCQNDSIAFQLENIGGGLFNSETYYVFEDHVIMRTGNTGNIPVGASFDLAILADTGKTYRISVPQNFGFPKLIGDTIASAVIEGCVPYLDGTFNIGFMTQFSNGNSAPFVAVDCQPNIGSYDPNDKSAQPAGYDGQHYIYDYTDLDYKIRFQNTGTDTAFLVVLRDTISPLLDLTTLEMGASSHSYTWQVYGNRVLEIRFDNILLPDSTTNELESNGFVRYRIEQHDGNVSGDVIYNAADIYFDFNAPIRTNETFHTIGENFVTIILSETTVLDEVIQVKVYPNPFTQNATLEVEGKAYDELQLTIYDVSGRVVLEKQAYSNNKIELSRGNLQPGVYFYQLLGDTALINTGKIVVQ